MPLLPVLAVMSVTVLSRDVTTEPAPRPTAKVLSRRRGKMRVKIQGEAKLCNEKAVPTIDAGRPWEIELSFVTSPPDVVALGGTCTMLVEIGPLPTRRPYRVRVLP